MRILIIGGHGLLGQKLVELCRRVPGLTTLATVRRHAEPLPGVTYFRLDITDAEQVHDIISSSRPDALVVTAAMTQADECETHQDTCWKTNAESMRPIVASANAVNAHVTYVSTDFVFDGEQEYLSEKAIPSPVNFYGRSKLAAEDWVRNHANEWCIIRTVLVYGVSSDMSRSNIILWVKQSLEQGSPIRVVNDQWRTPTYAEDLATGCLLAVRKRAQGIFHISGKDRLSPFDVAVKTASFFSLDASLITPVPSSAFVQKAKRPLKTGFDISKAREELLYEPHSFDEGLRLMAAQLPNPP